MGSASIGHDPDVVMTNSLGSELVCGVMEPGTVLGVEGMWG